MKTWKWLIVLMVFISIGVLVASGLFAERFQPQLKFPVSFGYEQVQQNRPFPGRSGFLLGSFGALVTLCLSGILVLYVAPGRVRKIADSFPNKTRWLLRLMLIGFLVGILVLAVGVGSALMIGTFPLTILLVGSLFIISFLGFVSLAFSLGRSLLRRAGWQRGSPLYALLSGTVILFALVRVPLLGAILFLMIASLGLGATIVSHFGSGQAWNLNSLMEEVENEKTHKLVEEN